MWTRELLILTCACLGLALASAPKPPTHALQARWLVPSVTVPAGETVPQFLAALEPPRGAAADPWAGDVFARTQNDR